MKRWGWAVVALFLAAGLTAQTLDQPVATIKLDKKSSLVSQKAFRDQISALESSQNVKLGPEDKSKVLDEMIIQELIRMDIDAQGIKANDEDLLKQFRTSNPGLTDAQIRAEVEKQAGKPWDDAVVGLKRQVAMMKYFNQFPQAANVGKVTVTDQDVQAFYDANNARYAAPDYIRVSHIFFDTKVHPKGTLTEIQQRAADTLKKITSGQATFEEMAAAVSDDATSAKVNGDIGFLPRTLDGPMGLQLQRVFGPDFLNAAFALKKGEVSGIMTSNSGLHIVRVTQKIDKRFLGLDDPVFPGQQETVRMAIQRQLQQKKLSENQAKMVQDIGNNLRAKATVKIFEQNF